jgi:hypothetical protein
MPTTWPQIKDGYGFEAVPAGLRRELACCVCGASDTGRGTLYSMESLRHDGTVRGHGRLVSRLRGNCYCRPHAEWHFRDRGGAG